MNGNNRIRLYKDPDGVIWESICTVVDKIDGTLCVLLKNPQEPRNTYVMPYHYLYEKRILDGVKVNSFEALPETPYDPIQNLNRPSTLSNTLPPAGHSYDLYKG